MKRVIFILFIIIVVIIIGILGVVSYREYNKKKLIDDIKKHYALNITVVENSDLYIKNDNKYISIGKVKQNVSLELNNIIDIDENTKYFRIKNTDYYLYYEDCMQLNDSIIEYEIPLNYLFFNKNVVTNKNTVLYSNGSEIFNIEENFELPLLYQDDINYYVMYLHKIYGIRKDSAELVDSINTVEKESEYVSIIHYKDIANNDCNLEKCISVSKIEEQLTMMVENNNYTIDRDDYFNWIKGNIRLKEKAIMIVVDDDKFIESLFDNYNYQYILEDNLDDIELLSNYKSSKKNGSIDILSSYLINNKNSDEIISKVLIGEDYIVDSSDKNSLSSDSEMNATKIAVLNYHFFYDRSLGQSCNESICLESSKFEEQLKYLTDNDYKTLTIDEFKKWMYGEIELPKKSVLLTIDDGAKGTGFDNGNVLIPLLEKYGVNATLFLISGWWSPDNYRSEYLDIQSHTWDMHREGYCQSETRGSQLLCSSYEEVLRDLTNSINDVDSNTAFCFPFYAYNDTILKALDEKGFKIAFIGGGYKATRNSNKYLIPRYVIYNNITLNQFVSYVN